MPEYAQKNPELGYWHALGMLMREGLLKPFDLKQLPLEQYLFYIMEEESAQKYQKIQQDEMAANTKTLMNRIRRR